MTLRTQRVERFEILVMMVAVQDGSDEIGQGWTTWSRSSGRCADVGSSGPSTTPGSTAAACRSMTAPIQPASAWPRV